jgi:hypothetical protein
VTDTPDRQLCATADGHLLACEWPTWADIVEKLDVEFAVLI